MVDINQVVNESVSNIDIGSVLSKLPGFSSLVKVGIGLGIVIIIYVVFLIIRSITQILYSRRFGKMTRNVEEINQKMDILLRNTSKANKKK